MRNFMITLAFCLCTATLFAQQSTNSTGTPTVYTSRLTNYNYKATEDDKRRQRAWRITDSIRNAPQWKAEIAAISSEFYNSAAWKTSKEESAKALPLWDEHSTTGNKAWQDAVAKINAELENTEAFKTYQQKVKEFNKRLDHETLELIYKNNPR